VRCPPGSRARRLVAENSSWVSPETNQKIVGPAWSGKYPNIRAPSFPCRNFFFFFRKTTSVASAPDRTSQGRAHYPHGPPGRFLIVIFPWSFFSLDGPSPEPAKRETRNNAQEIESIRPRVRGGGRSAVPTRARLCALGISNRADGNHQAAQVWFHRRLCLLPREPLLR